MHESHVDQPPSKRGHALRVEPMRARVKVGTQGRRVLAQSARAIAQSRELEVRVKQLEALLRMPEGGAVKLADAAPERLAARRNAHAIVRSDLVTAVSHDLRTPLQAILGYAELLAESATEELTATQREFARRIVISGLSLAQVVENLIQLSAAQLGRTQLDIASFDLKRLITDVVRLADPLARHKGIVLHADLVPLEMTSDRHRIRQIVTNLVEAAIKRTENGEVVVHLADAGPPDQATVRITVRDSGHATDATDVSNAFASLWEGRQPVLTSMRDTGLALSTAWHLTRVLGGAVRAEAAPSGGSTFTVELPRRVAPASESLAG